MSFDEDYSNFDTSHMNTAILEALTFLNYYYYNHVSPKWGQVYGC